MDTDTYPDAAVQKLISEHFVPVKLDKDTQKEAVDAYQVGPIPDTVVTLPDGMVVHRFLGFRPPEGLVEELKSALDARRKLDGLQRRLREEPGDLEARLDLGALYAGWKQWAKARAEFAAVVEGTAKEEKSELRVRALYQTGLAHLRAGDEASADAAFKRMGDVATDAARDLADDVAIERGIAAHERGLAALRSDPPAATRHFADARKRLEAFVKDHPSGERAAEGWFHLALATALGGDEAGGLATLKELARKHPGTEWAARASEIVKRVEGLGDVKEDKD